MALDLTFLFYSLLTIENGSGEISSGSGLGLACATDWIVGGRLLSCLPSVTFPGQDPEALREEDKGGNGYELHHSKEEGVPEPQVSTCKPVGDGARWGPGAS